ncbi:MAG TPA: hypothetical protein VLM89_15725 [Phycisphaerae bacterium]|nr:hypothetical protein [Phycisphaerae bacterium]
MRSLLLLIVATLILVPGCSRKDDPIPEQLIGRWIQETPESKNASPQARAENLTYQFNPDGTVVMSHGPLLETRSYQIKDGKLIIKGREPQTLHEMTANRLVIGDGPNQMVFTR